MQGVFHLRSQATSRRYVGVCDRRGVHASKSLEGTGSGERGKEKQVKNGGPKPLVVGVGVVRGGGVGFDRWEGGREKGRIRSGMGKGVNHKFWGVIKMGGKAMLNSGRPKR